MSPRRAARRIRSRRLAAGTWAALVVLVGARSAGAQAPPRNVRLEWNRGKTQVRASLDFRDVVDGKIRRKLNRGLPTTIVFTATIHRQGVKDPVSTTAQTCRITWLVWDEYYRIEITRPSGARIEKTLTVEGVLRRCAEARRLLVGDDGQIPMGAPLFLKAKVQVNPISRDVLDKLKRWVSRPTGTGTAGPSDALFSTFTGLFLQRIGKAERELKLTTKTAIPVVPKPKPKRRGKG